MSAFIDTNVLAYAQGSGVTSEAAREVLPDWGVVSMRVPDKCVAAVRFGNPVSS